MIRLLVFGLLLSACSQVKTLNLKRHNFSAEPSQVVWLQVAGLKPEHFSMLRFASSTSDQRLSFENATCVANLWNYNLYTLRPSASESFHSQVHGTKNIKNSCDDFKRGPFWEKLGTQDFHPGILETSGLHSNYEKVKACSEEASAYSSTTFWRMTSPPDEEAKSFHYQSPGEFSQGEVYYDQSCSGDTCFAEINRNIEIIWENFSKDYNRKVLVIRDFSYLEALKNRDIQKAREILFQIEKTYDYFSKIEKSKSDFLLILSSAESIGLEMPLEHEQWSEFESRARHVTFQKSSLDSMLLAQGAMAENLCGMYEEAEVSHRIRWAPEKKQFFLFN